MKLKALGAGDAAQWKTAGLVQLVPGFGPQHGRGKDPNATTMSQCC